ncbi:MAG TPA: MarR family transcriptional regulator [Candidatus Micrarchaeaceae archaeon]|nr:MarR family transcriptional regulator [Candidatus Micrarchaeaceae archaeon]
MTSSLAPASTQTETKEALIAYLGAMALAEPIQARLWQEAEITLTQLSVLRVLREAPQTSGRLGFEAELSPTSVTRIVDRLERRGLVTRRREGEDRRYVEIHLEPAGERLLGQLKILRGSDLYRAVEAMTNDDRRRLTASLRHLVELARSVRRVAD